MKIQFGNKDKDGGLDFSKKYGMISIDNYNSLIDENIKENQRKIKKEEKEREREVDLKMEEKKEIFEKNQKNEKKGLILKQNKGKIVVKTEIDGKVNSLVSEIEKIDLNRRLSTNMSQSKKALHKENLIKPILKSKENTIINDFNKQIILNKYWGSEAGDMSKKKQKNEISNLKIIKTSKNEGIGMGSLNKKTFAESFFLIDDEENEKRHKQMKIDHKDFKLPEINTKSRVKSRFIGNEEIPFV